MKHNITIFGNKTTTADLIRYLAGEGHKISLIVTLSKEVEASKDISGADDIETLGRAMSIPVHVTRSYRLLSAEDKLFFKNNEFGIGLCTGWQRLLPKHVLEAFPAGIFGFHGSCWPLPNGRGRSPLNWSMRRGGDRIYHNCFRYVEEADAGEIFNTTEFPITPYDSISSVQFKALLDMKQVSSRLLRQYAAGGVETFAQPGGESQWLPKLGPEDGHIRFGVMPCREILNLINATSRPFPGAFGVADGQGTLKIWRAAPFDFPCGAEAVAAVPGTVVDCSLGQILIKCLDGFILASDYEFVAAAGEAKVAPGLKFT